jgi:putative transposase
MDMGCYRANSQANPWSLYFKIQEYNNCRERHLFLSSLIRIYGKHTVYSDGGGTWYHEACVSLGLKQRLHSSYEKNIVERTIEYLKIIRRDI